MPSESQWSNTMTKMRSNLLVVPPFECAWLADDDLRFPEPGRGCIAFEACTDNDVTVVLKDKAGSKHYRTDMDPNYAIVLGSHRNRRLKIEVDGIPVFDAAGVVVSPSRFERFWISICDGHITVGKGDPGKGILFEWKHSETTRKVQYVGLSSWDKHVGYRNIRVFPYTKCRPLLEKLVHSASRGLASFVESPDFADVQFCVGAEQKLVPAHRLVLACCCSRFSSNASFQKDLISLPSVEYPTLHAFLQYMYTGQTQLSRSQLSSLHWLSNKFGLDALTNHCRKHLDDADADHASDIVQLIYDCPTESCDPKSFAKMAAMNPSKLGAFFNSCEFSDVEIFINGTDFVARAHKLVLSAWSIPFAKMFTNGMQESKLERINFKDVQHDVLLAMLKFMYTAHLDFDDVNLDLLSVLLLADQFDIPALQHACCLKLVDAVSERSVCTILQIVTSLPYCELLEDACVEFFAKNFEACVHHASDFKELEAVSFKKVLQSSDLCVTTEERVLNVIVQWASTVDHIHDWREANNYLVTNSLDQLFSERKSILNELPNYVRFALMPGPVLLEMQSCNLVVNIPKWKDMIDEALQYLAADKEIENHKNIDNRDRLVQLSYNSIRFSYRSSNFKELLYIHDGDSNGVIYFAGTSYGAHAWMNPVLTKKISVVASSPPSRFTDPKSLVSRQYQATSFAGPYFEGGHPSSWWKIDLGRDNQLMCNHYTLRQDGSVNYMRSWSLQGSNDDKDWLDLRVHNDDGTLSQTGQFASWPIHAANAYKPFRFFRVILTGKTSSISHPWNLCICYIELYGYFKCCDIDK